MGGGGKNAAKRQAEQARRDEQERQARIRQGTDAINRTFDGGWRGTGAVEAGATFDPNQTYYTASGEVWKPPASLTWSQGSGGGQAQQPAKTGNPLQDALLGISGLPATRDTGNSGGNRPTNPLQEMFLGAFNAQKDPWAEALKGGLYTGREEHQGFDDDFFGGIRQGYIDFARPELDRQFNEASKQNTFNLARAGTLDSSIRSETTGKLQEARDKSLADLFDKANEYEANSRNKIEDARADLISQLQVTGDATGAANAALARAGALATPPAYSPLDQLFTDFTSTLATQAALERAEAFGSPVRPRYNTGLFGVSPGAVRTS
ncbi:hypothetical protein RZ532_00930 [Nitratireductor aquimarinus]|uniref:hypothetical protein n=1 Tax=Nitratireductor aquimarinus TaxID=889300 RepID=UPI002936BD23|nr:hypothetical protein [Nitratireductor aquimarinus]MDV2964524.1 hypothetical protein [Nitratireductor aquimarinus]